MLYCERFRNLQIKLTISMRLKRTKLLNYEGRYLAYGQGLSIVMRSSGPSAMSSSSDGGPVRGWLDRVATNEISMTSQRPCPRPGQMQSIAASWWLIILSLPKDERASRGWFDRLSMSELEETSQPSWPGPNGVYKGRCRLLYS